MRPSRVLPCATATSASVLPVCNSVRSSASLMPMYVAAVARPFGDPNGPPETKMAAPPGSCAMTASAATGESAAAATPPVSAKVMPLAMSTLSMYFMSVPFQELLT